MSGNIDKESSAVTAGLANVSLSPWKLRNQGASAGKLASGVLILAVLGALLLLGYGLAFVAPQNPAAPPPEVTAQFLPSALVVPLAPKPHDRFIFQWFVVLGFAGIVAAALVARAAGLARVDPRVAFTICAAICAAIGMSLGAGPRLFILFSEPRLAGTLLVLLLTFVLAATNLLSETIQDRVRSILIGVAFLAAGFLAYETKVFSREAISFDNVFTSHFEAGVYSIVKTADGGTCLADVRAQYGCYGEFIAPILRITGASIQNLTLILASLLMLAILSILIFLSSIVRNPAFFFAASCSVVALLNLHPFYGMVHPYFQYDPVRILFPALSLLCVLAAQRWPGAQNPLLLGIFSGASVAWNVDTGIAVTVALAMFAFVEGFNWTLRQGWLAAIKRVSYFALGVVAFLALFLAYLEIKSGGHVDISSALYFQRLFYFSGFVMLPLPAFPAFWTIAVVVIIVALLVSILAMAASAQDRTSVRCAYLAVLGTGLMLYYSGRSHWVVLMLVIWPSVVLFYCLADQAIRASRHFAVKLVFVCVIAALPMAIILAVFPHWSNVTAYSRPPGPDGVLSGQIAFVRANTVKGERVGIIANNQTTLYVESGVSIALPGPSLAELLLVQDLRKLKQDIASEGPSKLFVDPVSARYFSTKDLDLGAHYDVVTQSSDQSLVYFRRR